MLNRLLMKHAVILFIVCSFVVLSCKSNKKKAEHQKDNRTLVPNPEGLKKDSFMLTENETDCSFQRFIQDASTPVVAKQLLTKSAKYSEEPLSYFDSLQSTDPEKRAFYFRVITNSYAWADGAYAEGLGNLGKEFIENHPQLFASFFDSNNCFTEKDLNTWAKIVLLEFEILDENIEKGNAQPLISLFAEQLIRNSANYSDNQKKTITQFAGYLNDEWNKFLLHIEG